MINKDNPWKGMDYSSQRRVDSNITHNIFWVTDLSGNYGFNIKAKNIQFLTINTIKLKGISIIKRPNGDFSELFLILKEKEDWQIFYTLCQDLIDVAKRSTNEDDMVRVTEIRLIRWQHLLKKDRNGDFTKEKQMGLFSELLCLKNVVAPKVGISQAIKTWCGPDYDKQDFLLEDSVIEVKSYKSSKSGLINISSKEQLFSEKEPFYLITYALSNFENGNTVEDMVKKIKKIISLGPDNNILDIFEDKLIDYGFIPEIISEPLEKFIVDKQRVYLVTDSFPRIAPKDIMNQITYVKYTIDLSKCKEFEIEYNSLGELND
jgi:hypothetical protein